jgi:hypothetical protein
MVMSFPQRVQVGAGERSSICRILRVPDYGGVGRQSRPGKWDFTKMYFVTRETVPQPTSGARRIGTNT